jgi:hypothetical protein
MSTTTDLPQTRLLKEPIKTPHSSRPVEACDCLDVLRRNVKAECGETAELDLSFWTNLETGESEAGLQPLRYRWKEKGKTRRSYIHFNFCPFCGRRKS